MHLRETVEYIAHERSIYEYWVSLLPHQVEFQFGASWKGKKKNLSKQVPRELTESGNSRFDLLSVPQQLSVVTGSTLTMKSGATQKLATTGWLDRDDSP